MSEAERYLTDPGDYPGLPRRTAAERLFTIAKYPVFSPSLSWTLYRVVDDEDAFFVRRVVVARGPEDEATHEGAEAKVPVDKALSLLKRLDGLRIPLRIPFDQVGVDGESYSVDLGTYMAGVKLRWWCDAPAPWAELQRWFQKAVARFDKRLPEL